MSKRRKPSPQAAKSSSDKGENAFAAGRELADSFFQQAEELSPKIVHEVMALRRDYLRAWAEGVGSWIDFSEDLLHRLNVKPKLSSDLKNMARDVTETWIKAEQEVITGSIGVSRSFVRATAAASQAINAVGFQATNAIVSIVKSRAREPKQAVKEVVEQVGAA